MLDCLIRIAVILYFDLCCRRIVFPRFLIKLANPDAADPATVRAGIARLRQKKVTEYSKKAVHTHSISLTQNPKGRNGHLRLALLPNLGHPYAVYHEMNFQ